MRTLGHHAVLSRHKADGEPLCTVVPGSAALESSLSGLVRTQNGDFVSVGYVVPAGGEPQGWFVRWGADCSVKIDARLGGDGAEYLDGVAELPDGSFIAAGTATNVGQPASDGWLVRLTADGSLLAEATVGGGTADSFSDIAWRDGLGFAAVGSTESYGSGALDTWLVRGDAFLNASCSSAGGCIEKTSDACADGDPCTLDHCNAVKSCYYPDAPAATHCDDGAACTVIDTCSLGSCAGAPGLFDQLTYGTELNDAIMRMVWLPDGGFVTAGWTDKDGKAETQFATALRFDAKGTLIGKYQDGPNHSFLSVRPAADGTFVAVGRTLNGQASDYHWVHLGAKLDEVIDLASLGGEHGYAYDVQPAVGGWVLLGFTYGGSDYSPDKLDLQLLWTNEKGQKVNQIEFGGPGQQWPSSLAVAKNGDLIVAGQTYAPGSDVPNSALFRRTAAGQPVCMGATGGVDVNNWSVGVIELADGDLLLTGASVSAKGDQDGWLMRFDANCKPEVETTLPDLGDGTFSRAVALPDGTLLVAGSTSAEGPAGRNGRVAHMTTGGALLGSIVLGGAGTDTLNSIAWLDGKGFATGGSTNSFGAGAYDVWLVRGDSFLNLACETAGGCADKPFAECNDANPCTIDSCKGGVCGHVDAADGTDCGDAHECLEGVCVEPAQSCKALLAAKPASPNGLYAIDPDGPESPLHLPLRAWCDMEDGGWTLVANIYDSADDDIPNDVATLIPGWQNKPGGGWLPRAHFVDRATGSGVSAALGVWGVFAMSSIQAVAIKMCLINPAGAEKCRSTVDGSLVAPSAPANLGNPELAKFIPGLACNSPGCAPAYTYGRLTGIPGSGSAFTGLKSASFCIPRVAGLQSEWGDQSPVSDPNGGLCEIAAPDGPDAVWHGWGSGMACRPGNEDTAMELAASKGPAIHSAGYRVYIR